MEGMERGSREGGGEEKRGGEDGVAQVRIGEVWKLGKRVIERKKEGRDLEKTIL